MPLAALLLSGTAHATYSIVGTDRATRHVGVAGTSCVAPSSVFTIYGSSPGRGAVAAQALVNNAGRTLAVQRLGMGVAPAEIITELTGAFDRSAAQRQYGVVDVMGRAAAHTGTSNSAFAGDRQGMTGDFAYSIQGNILTSAMVLTQAVAAFDRPACDLAEHLMAALEGGAQNAQGDRRCAPAPSDTAFVAVDRPDEPAGTYLRLRVEGPRRTNPLPRLRTMFEAWRATHPCPGAGPDAAVVVDARPDLPDRTLADGRVVPDAAPDRPTDVAAGGAGGTATGGAGGSTGAGGAGAGGSGPGGGGAGGSGAGGTAATDAAGGTPPGDHPGGSGCRCDAGGPPSTAWPAPLLLLLISLRCRRGGSPARQSRRGHRGTIPAPSSPPR